MIEKNGVKLSINGVTHKIAIEAPWTTYYKEVNALFKLDPEVSVLYNHEEPELKIVVRGNLEKAASIGRFFPRIKKFGNVTLNISVVDANGQSVPDINCPNQEAIEKMFADNEAVSFIKHVETIFGDTITYVVFEREVVQFYADNLTDLFGVISTLYQNIARDVFEDTIVAAGTCFFCTNIANFSNIEKATAKWP